MYRHTQQISPSQVSNATIANGMTPHTVTQTVKVSHFHPSLLYFVLLKYCRTAGPRLS